MYITKQLIIVVIIICSHFRLLSITILTLVVFLLHSVSVVAFAAQCSKSSFLIKVNINIQFFK